MDAFVTRKRDGPKAAPLKRKSSEVLDVRDDLSHVIDVEAIDDSADDRAPALSSSRVPLAERMRPKSIGDVMGQDVLIGPQCLLRRLLDSDSVPSMILWGPPGCGKTTIATTIAQSTRSRFIALSAISANAASIRETIEQARKSKAVGQKTIVFIDEIHRFNKTTQDLFLPHVESGLIILIGATTENPSFEVNAALLSRCRVFSLERLVPSTVAALIRRAISGDSVFSEHPFDVPDDVIEFLATVCDGDARVALNSLEMAMLASPISAEGIRTISLQDIKDTLQKTHVKYDKDGEEFYNMISALHKSVRGSDPDAALYWLTRMLMGGQEARVVARRLVRMASEDIGLADPQALPMAVAAFQAVQVVGRPECDLALVQCAVYLARAPKSNALEVAYNNVKKVIQSSPSEPVPIYLRNPVTGLMKNLGYGEDYKYNPDYGYKTGRQLGQDYLPASLSGTSFLPERWADPVPRAS